MSPSKLTGSLTLADQEPLVKLPGTTDVTVRTRGTNQTKPFSWPRPVSAEVTQTAILQTWIALHADPDTGGDEFLLMVAKRFLSNYSQLRQIDKALEITRMATYCSPAFVHQPANQKPGIQVAVRKKLAITTRQLKRQIELLNAEATRDTT